MPSTSITSTCKLISWTLCLLIAQCSLAHASPVLDRKETKEVKQKNGAVLYSRKQSGQPFQGQVNVKRGSTITTCVYQAGLRHGSCQQRQKNGLLSKAETFINGLRTSETRYFRDGKQIKRLTSYDPKTRKKHGAYAEYNKAGVVKVQGKYSAGERIGRWVLRSDENRLRKQVEFKGGKKHGASLEYNNKGQLQYETHYANGKPHGRYAYYSGKGEGNKMPLSEQGSYQHGQKHQTWIRYRRDSKVVSSKNIYNVGVLLEAFNYHPGGALFEHVKNDGNGRTLLIKTYYPSGKLEERRTFTYSAGMRHEKRESWNEDGSKK